MLWLNAFNYSISKLCRVDALQLSSKASIVVLSASFRAPNGERTVCRDAKLNPEQLCRHKGTAIPTSASLVIDSANEKFLPQTKCIECERFRGSSSRKLDSIWLSPSTSLIRQQHSHRKSSHYRHLLAHIVSSAPLRAQIQFCFDECGAESKLVAHAKVYCNGFLMFRRVPLQRASFAAALETLGYVRRNLERGAARSRREQ